MHTPLPVALLLAAAAGLAACGDKATLPVDAGTGPDPQLPPPHQTLLPTVEVAPAKGWPAGAPPPPPTSAPSPPWGCPPPRAGPPAPPRPRPPASGSPRSPTASITRAGS